MIHTGHRSPAAPADGLNDLNEDCVNTTSVVQVSCEDEAVIEDEAICSHDDVGYEDSDDNENDDFENNPKTTPSCFCFGYKKKKHKFK